ncbi:MAG: rod shape-determining protein MreD [Bacteroidales bacterium]|jgi:rod shape-determining protein MreD|nr:rod shape-determining protein MreD [Bacteroidales bacterium]HPJ82574.1 rod shape-determining protein MreD [Bacteroidales bacterium]
MNDNLKYTLRFLIFLAVQLLLFQNLNLGTYLAPMPYILFLLLFPCTYSTVLLMLWAFAFGLTLDVLGAGIMGLHTASFVVAGALRSTILKTVTVKGDLDNLMVPGFNQLGFGRYSIFVVLCVMAHHLVFFTLESLSFFLFWQTFARFLCSLLLNVFLILLFKKTFFERGR